jgi:hypothetical protein
MSNLTAVIGLHPQGEGEERFRFECAGGAVAVTASTDRLTPYGGAAAWSHYLEQLGVVADLARRFPLERSSPNATPVGDVVQAFMFNCLMGGRRFAHARRVQDDQALAVILGMKKGRLCGEDALYRMMEKVPREQARRWLAWSERDLYAALPAAFVGDWDSTVNTRYGKQEDVARGYNPHKPGRGSHHPLLCVVAGTRLALYMEWRPGNEVSAGHWIEAMERVWSHPDVPGRLQLNRGDIGFAQEKIMAWHEMPGVARPRYLFKLKLTANVRRAIAKVPWPEWDGQPSIGMEQYAEIRVKLDGWSCERRVIVTRILKPANPTPQDVFWGLDQEEFCAYVTNLDVQQATPPQIVLTYRKRGDAENVFDELKNQWGFSGFCSGKGVVSETAARLLLLTYNLWSLFVRVLKEEGCHREAITSRDDLLVMPAKLVESGRQKTLKLSVGEKWWAAISLSYQRLERWLGSIAPQLNPQQTFERYLCWLNPLNPDDWLPKPAS